MRIFSPFGSTFEKGVECGVEHVGIVVMQPIPKFENIQLKHLPHQKNHEVFERNLDSFGIVYLYT